jgi:phenylacetate-CoA ligase
MVERIYHNVPFYREKMQQQHLSPENIKSIDDLRKLPFTVKTDLRDNYPFGLFAVPQSQIIRLHASSGTTGKPTVVGYTRADIALWSEVIARSLSGAGVGQSDILQVAYGYGLFTGGLGLHYGAEKVGAAVIPISSGNTKRQLQLMEDFCTTAIACTPSYALFLAESMVEYNVKRESLKLRVGIFGAEPWTENMRKAIEEKLNIIAIDIYGLSEIIGPGVGCECENRCGMHINEDHFIPEIVDPKTLEPVPEGDLGELVFTTITKEGMPLLRYRTRDLTRFIPGMCNCGRTLPRIEKFCGRSDDMLIIRGVNVFPSQIESALLEMKETKPIYQLIVEREHNLDNVTLLVEVEDEYFSDEIKVLEALTAKIKHNLQSSLGISIKVKLADPKSIQRSEGKAQRIVDKRNLS